MCCSFIFDLAGLGSWNPGRIYTGANDGLPAHSWYFFNRGSQHVLQTLINYPFWKEHKHYSLNYIAEETEVHLIPSPSICRGRVPTSSS